MLKEGAWESDPKQQLLTELPTFHVRKSSADGRWELGRYRLAGTGYVRLEIAPCQISAVTAVGWNLNWKK